ncbi:MAG: class I SAM-dependent methyltransferase [Oscillospiraceae bacterium]|nr:class I SAM-dependent methyltransferase [Oscillospiraceae bacterium]
MIKNVFDFNNSIHSLNIEKDKQMQIDKNSRPGDTQQQDLEISKNIKVLIDDMEESKLIEKKFESQMLKIIIDRIESAAKNYNENATEKNSKDSPIKDIFSKIYNADDYWGGGKESKSGKGSTAKGTESLVKILPKIFEKYSIKKFLDAPCGDYAWMKRVDKKQIEYIGADVVPQMISKNNNDFKTKNVEFKVLDLTTDKIPKVDTIFCRDCLQHLTNENVQKVLDNFMKSESDFLMTTNYPLTLENININNGEMRYLNLLKPPFKIPESVVIERIAEDKCPENGLDKILYIIDLKKLRSLFKKSGS